MSFIKLNWCVLSFIIPFQDYEEDIHVIPFVSFFLLCFCLKLNSHFLSIPFHLNKSKEKKDTKRIKPNGKKKEENTQEITNPVLSLPSFLCFIERRASFTRLIPYPFNLNKERGKGKEWMREKGKEQERR